MSSISLDEHQLSTLTEEEQAAIRGDGFSEDELKAMNREAANSGNDDDTGDGDGDDGDVDEVLDADGNPVVLDTKQETPPADPPKAADTTPQAQEVPPAPQAKPAPQYQAQLPENYEQQVADLKTREVELRQKFKDGDIDLEEFDTQREAISAERDTLSRAALKAEISQEMTQQQAQANWTFQVQSLFATAKAAGVDYSANTALQSDLDLFVKRLAADDANADKPAEWFLTEGHKRVVALHGLATTAPAPTPKEESKPAPASRKAPIDAAPKTLAQVPGGDGPGDVGGEFAHLDALGGDDLENAIARMTPTQREKYSKGL